MYQESRVFEQVRRRAIVRKPEHRGIQGKILATATQCDQKSGSWY